MEKHNEEGKRKGRPPMIPPDDTAEAVLKLTSKGISEVSIARALGVSYDTWAKWRKEYPKIEEARKIGRGIEHDQLFDVLFKSATVDKNITSAMFLLKTRHGYLEGQPFDSQNKVQIVFQIPGALQIEEYEETLLKQALPKRELKKLRHRRLIRG
jgi:hypothetical protein